jgi:starch-binding outer membrane protein, SusD/RagB family
MKIQKYLFYMLLIATTIIVSSCDEEFGPNMNYDFTADQIWNDRDYQMGILVNGYNVLPSGYDAFSGSFLDCATDNAVTSDYISPLRDFAGGNWSADYSILNSWTTCYSQIRNMNLFLEKSPTISFSVDKSTDVKIKKRSKGEAFFLRAYYETELLIRFSGLTDDNKLMGFPIVTKVLSDIENSKIPRSTFDECVKQIYDDIDSSLVYLPGAYTGGDPELGTTKLGRATTPIALTLKSKVALYAASPLYTVNKSAAEKTVLWEMAATTAMAAIVASGNTLPAITNALYNTPDHAEVIWRSYQSNSNTLEKNNFIPQLFGKGYTNPSQQLVDAFPALNGYPISDPRSGYNASSPYSNRDTRFGLSILYNGAPFSGKTVQVFKGGLDSEQSRSSASRTGYYLKKFLVETVTFLPGVTNTTAKHYNALFRKGELWLNYAEAANETWGPTTDPKGLGKNALTTLLAIRKRGGIPTADLYATEVAAAGKDAFRTLIQNERRIELCFENQRFFDIRRWLLPLEKLNEPVRGVRLLKDNAGVITYEYGINVEPRNFKDYMYYGPIPAREIWSDNGVVKQNKGW